MKLSMQMSPQASMILVLRRFKPLFIMYAEMDV